MLRDKTAFFDAAKRRRGTLPQVPGDAAAALACGYFEPVLPLSGLLAAFCGSAVLAFAPWWRARCFLVFAPLAAAGADALAAEADATSGVDAAPRANAALAAKRPAVNAISSLFISDSFSERAKQSRLATKTRPPITTLTAKSKQM
ncbi:hypothetical protein DFQ28_007858 [Apophysomyces sp. BC1034]|nr:hypothetical protein DFQ28_007858 [Apophysomyces sp. BC1034]